MIQLFVITDFLIQFQVSNKRIINKLYIIEQYNKPSVTEPYVSTPYYQINHRKHIHE